MACRTLTNRYIDSINWISVTSTLAYRPHAYWIASSISQEPPWSGGSNPRGPTKQTHILLYQVWMSLAYRLVILR